MLPLCLYGLICTLLFFVVSLPEMSCLSGVELALCHSYLFVLV